MEFVRPEEGFEAPSAQQLKRAETLIRSNRHQEAHTLLAAMDIGALDPAQMEVRKSALKECEALLAGDLYMQAAEALGAKDYEQCRKLCRSIAQQYPTALSTIGEATRLEARVAASLQQDRYVRDLASLNKLLEGGNLPEALRELEKFKGVYARYEPLSHLLQPEDFASDYEQKIEAKTRVFKHMHQILEYYMTQNDKRALAKLEEMREEFPEHPYVEQTEEKLRDNVVAAPP
jgi:hypothetical protein